VADELYRSARRLRVFVARPASRDLAAVLGVVVLPAEEVRNRLQEGRALLA
jgi:hypothetical protein